MTLKEKYQKQIIPAMMKKFKYNNPLEVPKLVKVVLNVGLGRIAKDDKFLQIVEDNLQRITGQKSLLTKAKQSIAGFKTRQGQIVGKKVTIRGQRMFDFETMVCFPRFPESPRR